MAFHRQLICMALALSLYGERCAKSEDILAYFPFPAKSHHRVYQPIIEALAERGHRVTYVTPFPLENPPPNVTIISTESILTSGLSNYRPRLRPRPNFGLIDVFLEGNSGIFSREAPSFYKQVFVVEKTIRRMIFDETMKVDQVRALIDSKSNYDLVLHGLFLQEHAAAFQFKFNALGASIFPFGDFSWANELAGFPDNAAFMMNFHREASDDMNFFERMTNAVTLHVSTWWNYYELHCMQRDVDVIFNFNALENRPNIIQLVSDQALILSHWHHAVGYPFPRAPHFKTIGGIAIRRTNSIPEDLKKFMDESEKGVVYFSLGSTITASQLLSTAERDAFANAFAAMEERVLWKWEDGEWAGMPDNVKVAPWFPQADILAHEKCKLFITQGGLLSLFETIYFRVPVIAIPLFGDQPKNARFISSAPIGVHLDISNLTQSSIAWAIKASKDNQKFKQELRRRSELLRDSPDPKDEAIRWIEYVLKHGRALQSKGARLSYFQLHLLDVTAFLITAVILCLALVARLVAWKCRAFCKQMNSMLTNKEEIQ